MTKLIVLEDCRELYFMTKIFINKEEFKDMKFHLNDHILRSVVSIGSNIAEGNQKSDKDFQRFIKMARGSLAEYQFQLSLYGDNEELSNQCEKIKAKLIKLDNYIVNRQSSIVSRKM